MKKKETKKSELILWNMWTALDKDGFYWDIRIGKCAYPEAFISEQTAEAHATAIKEKWLTVVKPVKITVETRLS